LLHLVVIVVIIRCCSSSGDIIVGLPYVVELVVVHCRASSYGVVRRHHSYDVI